MNTSVQFLYNSCDNLQVKQKKLPYGQTPLILGPPGDPLREQENPKLVPNYQISLYSVNVYWFYLFNTKNVSSKIF